MKNKVYYGEYSLEHWIKLILKKNIVLPDYQRYYVWNQEKVKTLIESFNKKEFVPPVTVGAFTDEEGRKNLILDGQQRLTSIFLAYLNLFPNRKCEDWAPKDFIPLANTNDDSEIDEGNDYKGVDWNFNRLLSIGSSKASIKEKVKTEQYITLNVDIGEDFFKDNYLGFSFIVPSYDGEERKKEQIKFYSSVYRHINIQGEALSNVESRRSLYYLNDALEPFFDPDIFKNIKLNDKKLDFVRYLAILDSYKKQDYNISQVAAGNGNKLEQFYTDYVYKIAEEFDFDFDFDNKISILSKNLEYDFFPENFPSIIDADIYMFGLIYFSVFKEKKLILEKNSNLKAEIVNKISELKDLKIKAGQEFEGTLYSYEYDYEYGYYHQKSPNALKYIRLRLKESLELYKEYFSE